MVSHQGIWVPLNFVHFCVLLKLYSPGYGYFTYAYVCLDEYVHMFCTQITSADKSTDCVDDCSTCTVHDCVLGSCMCSNMYPYRICTSPFIALSPSILSIYSLLDIFIHNYLI